MVPIDANDEFQLRNDVIYLNHAGVSPWPMRTAKAVREFAEENMREGSLHYPAWLGVETELRRRAMQLLNAPSEDDIALLKNTSEALSVIAYGLDWKDGDNIVISNQEFPSNRIVWESLAHKGVELREADLSGPSTPENAVISMSDGDTRLISVSSVQFSTGLRMDLEAIGSFCRRRGILFCVDAIQSLGAVQLDVRNIDADFVMADGHKWMLGPEGLAVFYSNPESRNHVRLNQYGWHMVEDAGNFDRREWSIARTARRFECGSPNMLGIHALNASLSLLLEQGMDNIEREVLKRSEYLFEKISARPELELITSTGPDRYAGIVTFRRRDADPALLYRHLMQNNVVCALRSGGIRLSPHFYTPYEKLDHVLELVEEYRV
ncbi:MAG: aminotransferase class V-fold PLP-dependent enzyme [Nitrospiraceae bacterium]|nr:MAG: aminotransferase class V-fold PLP-dependent enzyme [Nitrospiraceae bacterium]